MYIFKAGVVGAGTMGSQIAQVISSSGLPVVMKDVDQATLDGGIAHIRRIYQGQVDKGNMSAVEMERQLSLVEPALTYDSFGDVDIVIEAVPEKMDVKKRVLAELEGAVPETTIFASNTSALSISEMASSTKRPGKVIGVHFFNPAHVMKLVEIIPGLETSQETIDDVVAFVELLRSPALAGRSPALAGRSPTLAGRKIAIVVQECPGFLVNRLLMPYLNEATRCLEEGVATASEIDAAATDFGMPMGPFALMDMLGVDVCNSVAAYLYEEYGPRMEPAGLLSGLVDGQRPGQLGEKSGKGFYDYGDETRESRSPALAGRSPAPAGMQQVGAGLVPAQASSPDPSSPVSTFSVERLVYPLINEAVLALQEHIASRQDIDVAMIAGTGMTYHGERKGPLAIADVIGLDIVLGELEKLHARYPNGERFRPARLLRTKVRAGHLGVKARRGFHEYA